MAKGCGSCKQAQAMRMGSARPPARAMVSTCKVVDTAGDCLLADGLGRCRVFADETAARAAASAELAPGVQYAVQPVRLG